MKTYHLLALALSVSLGMTACNTSQQPNRQANEHNSHPQSTVNQHDTHTADTTASTDKTKPAHVVAYMDSMAKMHDDMANGVQAKNADVGFAKGMTPHHQGAIDMANIELQYGKDAEMKALAQNIIDAQQGEIKQMQDWLTANEAKLPNTDNADQITKAHKANMMKNHDAMMQGITATDPDVAFVKGMIPHHQGAIDMSDVELKYGKDPAMRQLAEQIKQAQAPEIKQMQDWLDKKGVK